METKFLYPNHLQKEILDELEKITSVLANPPTKELKKNMRFVKKFTYSLLLTGKLHAIKKHPVKKYPVKHILIKTKPLQEQKQEKIIAPPPPPPPSTITKQHPTSPIYIRLKKENGILKYESIEPIMEQQDWKVFTKIKSVIKEQLSKNPNILENENFLSKEIQKVTKELKIKFTQDYAKKIKYYLTKHIKGYGKIDPLMNDNKVSSIICKSYNDLEVSYNNETLKTNIKFDTNQELNNFILTLAEKFNRQISENNPFSEFSTDRFKISLNYNLIMGSSFRIDKL